jgi:hypothetical protein
MAGLFDSAWLKWGWAVREAELLERDLADFINHEEFQRLRWHSAARVPAVSNGRATYNSRRCPAQYRL